MGQSNFRPRHRKQFNKSFNGRKAIDELYGRDWELYRERFLKINNECYACGERANVVDHLIPHQGDVRLFEKLDNHIPLCIRCHNTVTSLFDRKFRQGDSITPKIEWLSRKRIPGIRAWKRVKVLSSYRLTDL